MFMCVRVRVRARVCARACAWACAGAWSVGVRVGVRLSVCVCACVCVRAGVYVCTSSFTVLFFSCWGTFHPYDAQNTVEKYKKIKIR